MKDPRSTYFWGIRYSCVRRSGLNLRYRRCGEQIKVVKYTKLFICQQTFLSPTNVKILINFCAGIKELLLPQGRESARYLICVWGTRKMYAS